MDFALEKTFSQHLVYMLSLTGILEKDSKITNGKTICSRAKIY